MKVISIDPAWDRQYAVATFQDGKYVDCSLILIKNIGWTLSRNAKIKDEVQVVVEEGYIGPNKKGSRNICYAVGKVLGLCEYFEIPCNLMSIKQWKSEHKIADKTGKLKLVIMKHLVKKITNQDIDNIDKQCAILIGQAWINKNGGK